MTRTEKYKKYRDEIEHTTFDDEEKSKKEQSAEMVDEILKKENRGTNNLSFNELKEIHDIYVEPEPVEKKKKINPIKKKQILFVIICSVVIIGLLIGLILVGIKLFGGN